MRVALHMVHAVQCLWCTVTVYSSGVLTAALVPNPQTLLPAMRGRQGAARAFALISPVYT